MRASAKPRLERGDQRERKGYRRDGDEWRLTNEASGEHGADRLRMDERRRRFSVWRIPSGKLDGLAATVESRQNAADHDGASGEVLDSPIPIPAARAAQHLRHGI